MREISGKSELPSDSSQQYTLKNATQILLGTQYLSYSPNRHK